MILARFAAAAFAMVLALAGGASAVVNTTFPSTTGTLVLKGPFGVDAVPVTGTMSVTLDETTLSDPDGDGLEQGPTEITALSLSGNGPLVGPILVSLRPAGSSPFQQSLGALEEGQNNVANLLELHPLIPSPSPAKGESFFDVFVTVNVGGQDLHNEAPKYLSASVTEWPPLPGETLAGAGVVDLYDAANVPTGISLGLWFETFSGVAEHDVFLGSLAQVEVQIGATTEIVEGYGDTGVWVNLSQIGDPDLDGREQAPAEMVQLEVTGTSSLGPVALHIRDPQDDPFMRSVGEIEETVNLTPGVLDVPPFTPTGSADSFFDVFFEIEVPAIPIVLHNQSGKRMTTKMFYKPPWQHTYVGDAPVPLVDPANNPSGVTVTRARHRPGPPPPLPPLPPLPPVLLMPDHYVCYEGKRAALPPIAPLTLVDQFGTHTDVVARRSTGLCAPVDKNGEDLLAVVEPQHLERVRVRYRTAPVRNVTVVSQFGPVDVDVGRPHHILVPTAKGFFVPPPPLVPPLVDHFACYRTRRSRGALKPLKFIDVDFQDQLTTATLAVTAPRYLCAPVDKNGTTPGAELHPVHLVCYRTTRAPFPTLPVLLNNQFGPHEALLIHRQELCVPAIKLLP